MAAVIVSATPWVLWSALFLSEAASGTEVQGCLGGYTIGGHGTVAVVDGSERVNPRLDVIDEVFLEAFLDGRVRFANDCNEGRPPAVNLLDHKLSYTVDLSGAGCACSASFVLVGLNESTGGMCTTESPECVRLTLQNANRHFWRSDDAAPFEQSAVQAVVDSSKEGYAPGGYCVDTKLPFHVAIAFPADNEGNLLRVEVRLSQGGVECTPVDTFDASPARMKRLSKALSVGMTPTMTYLEAPAAELQSGAACRGVSTGGPASASESCAQAVMFGDFNISPLRKPKVQVADASVAAPVVPPDDASGMGVLPEKICVRGWRPHQSCVDGFFFKGEAVLGCTDHDIDQPWCSTDETFQGHRELCIPCGEVFVEQEAEAKARGESGRPPARPAVPSPAAGPPTEIPCVGNWKRHKDCVDKFEYSGKVIEGCTGFDYRQPWCSPDANFSGLRLMCLPCGWAPPRPPLIDAADNPSSTKVEDEAHAMARKVDEAAAQAETRAEAELKAEAAARAQAERYRQAQARAAAELAAEASRARAKRVEEAQPRGEVMVLMEEEGAGEPPTQREPPSAARGMPQLSWVAAIWGSCAVMGICLSVTFLARTCLEANVASSARQLLPTHDVEVGEAEGGEGDMAIVE